MIGLSMTLLSSRFLTTELILSWIAPTVTISTLTHLLTSHNQCTLLFAARSPDFLFSGSLWWWSAVRLLTIRRDWLIQRLSYHLLCLIYRRALSNKESDHMLYRIREEINWFLVRPFTLDFLKLLSFIELHTWLCLGCSLLSAWGLH
jgi:hypothetical protein